MPPQWPETQCRDRPGPESELSVGGDVVPSGFVLVEVVDQLRGRLSLKLTGLPIVR
jgi:hypothetical protein